jgi:hypothetical protein
MWLLCLLVATSGLAVPGTPPVLEVELDGSSLRAAGKVGQLTLVVRNHTVHPITAGVTLAFLENGRDELVSDSSRVTLAPGLNRLSTDFGRALIFDDEELLVAELDLRYQLEPERGEPVRGMLPLISLLPDAFMLSPVLPSPTLVTGDRDLVVHALHPSRGTPAAGVKLEVLVDEVAVDSASTGSDGSAVLELPDIAWPASFTTVTINGRRGRWQHSVEALLEEEWEGYLSLATDLPVYRPGSTLHYRLLAFAPDRRALAGESISVKLEGGPRGRKVFRSAELTTDEHGMAHGSWDLDGLTEEAYDLIAETAGGIEAEREIIIERFRTPALLVAAEQERPYYLPGEVVRFEITTTTASGLPLPEAPVRLLIDRWHRHVDIDNQEVAWQGTTGSDGACWAELSLSELMSWSYLPDVYTTDELLRVEATDPITGATASALVTIRLARHQLIVRAKAPADAISGLPAELHIITLTPTGEPVAAEVAVYRRDTDRSDDHQVIAPEKWPVGPLLARVETDERGVAVLWQPLVPFWEEELSELVLEVSTADGRQRTVEVEALASSTLQVYPSRVLLAPGEPIELEVSGLYEQVLIDAFAGPRHVGGTVHSATPAGGRARVTIPYHPLMQGEVSLFVTTSMGPVDIYGPERTAAVVYPAEDLSPLRITLATSPVVAAPGEKVHAVLHCQGSPSQTTLLGVAVVDGAADSYLSDLGWQQEFVDRPWFLGTSTCGLDRLHQCYDYEEYWGGLHSGEVAGISRLDLPGLAASESRAEYDAVARLLLAESPDPDLSAMAWWELEESGDLEWWAEPDPEAPETGLESYEQALDDAFAAGTAAVLQQDAAAFAAELARHGVDLGVLRDPWGGRYRVGFTVEGRDVTARLISAGPDRRADEEQTDDLIAWEDTLDAFAPLEERITGVLETALAEDDPLLSGGADGISDLLRRAGLTDLDLVDPRGNPLDIEVLDLPGVGREIRIWGPGPDGRRGTRDDRGLASFMPQAAGDRITLEVLPGVRFVPEVSSTTGAIAGLAHVFWNGSRWPISVSLCRISDASGKPLDRQPRIRANVDRVGFFSFAGLVPGVYEIFAYQRSHEAEDLVTIKAGTVTYIDLELWRGPITEEIVVEGGARQGLLTSLSRRSRAHELLQAVRSRGSSGRLRQHFADTLLWRPDIIVEGDSTELSFDLADNLTTWKMQVMASTADGRWHTATADIHSVQPLVAELDLPPMLTTGDLLELPVTVRNYSAQSQEVVTGISPSGALAGTGEASRQRLQVSPLAAGRATFPVRAKTHGSASVEAPALAGELSDRLRLATEIRPYGRRTGRSAARQVHGETTFETEIPVTRIPGTSAATVRFYPDLLSHLSESAAGLVRRPTGCAEQITSTARVNLAVLELLSQSQAQHPSAVSAGKHLAEAVRMLERDLTPSGGYAFWGTTGTPYIGLTAYVTSFLIELDHQGSVAVPRHMIDRPLTWLAGQQHQGVWGDLQETVLVLRVLADAAGPEQAAPEVAPAIAAARRRLASEVRTSSDPYLVASYLIAVAQIGDEAEVRAAVARLQELAECDAQGCRWPGGPIPFWA